MARQLTKPVFGAPMTSAPFDRKEIMRAAHFTAKWRVLTVGGAYRDWFAKALSHEWRKAHDAKAWRERNAGAEILSFPSSRQHSRLNMRNANIAYLVAS
jgi:hypothetical protein